MTPDYIVPFSWSLFLFFLLFAFLGFLVLAIYAKIIWRVIKTIFSKDSDADLKIKIEIDNKTLDNKNKKD